MSKSKLIKLSGWAFIAGSFAFIAMLSGSIGSPIISSILLAAGMLGLRVGYGESAGSFGKNILLIGVVGMVLTYFGIFIAQQIETTKTLNFSDWWFLPFAGPAVLLFALTLFGLATLHSKSMARLNGLSVFAGIWYPVIYFSIIAYLFMNNGAWPEQLPYPAIEMMMLIQFFALCALGATLVSNTSQEMATA